MSERSYEISKVEPRYTIDITASRVYVSLVGQIHLQCPPVSHLVVKVSFIITNVSPNVGTGQINSRVRGASGVSCFYFDGLSCLALCPVKFST